MAGDTKDEGLCARQAATLTCLPSTAIYAILETTAIGKDVAALLTALPVSTLPPELVALRDLGAVVDLAHHWPVVRVAEIPIEHAHLAIAALPAFAGVHVDVGFAALAWLDAKLPPMKPVTLVVDPSVLGMLSAFAYAWGGLVTNVLINSHEVQPDPTPDILARCVNVQKVTITVLKRVTAAAYLAVLPTRHLLEMTMKAAGALDVAAIIAWLQGPSAMSLDLTCTSVSDPTWRACPRRCAGSRPRTTSHRSTSTTRCSAEKVSWSLDGHYLSGWLLGSRR
ncbi:hypothetical protein SPRG_14665 [Saprolegnia parasitica CBS 223.65]|uniref:Uncharacterized protein n=1 Tax=Saprolegnia parasitica (strain CBS 223.65) TaxID=695850 RepID=A0A067BY17_SAPPC|nr:hypothetical protein SPRG_14665 [Saprolegnia parasitica CBS 223.65]KDO19482.1 hypothetical protein SPRG_14665 [Saprolegnia parasitica CBS 223.65]|eukprot:XP_012209825.1 hypothetical protein SPRG_14665 [Saprolegnia parasitica CBS 223.65]